MKLNREEQILCNKYSQKGRDGLVKCHLCPLSIKFWNECKATMSEKEWRKYQEDVKWVKGE